MDSAVSGTVEYVEQVVVTQAARTILARTLAGAPRPGKDTPLAVVATSWVALVQGQNGLVAGAADPGNDANRNGNDETGRDHDSTHAQQPRESSRHSKHSRDVSTTALTARRFRH
mgnify:CR=1 FL=1